MRKRQNKSFQFTVLLAVLAFVGVSPANAAPKWKKVISSSGSSSLQGGFMEFGKDSSWTVPAGVTKIQVMVIGAGGGGGAGDGANNQTGISSSSSTGGNGSTNTISGGGGKGGTATAPGSNGGADGGCNGFTGTVDSRSGFCFSLTTDNPPTAFTKEPGDGGAASASGLTVGGAGGAVYIWW